MRGTRTKDTQSSRPFSALRSTLTRLVPVGLIATLAVVGLDSTQASAGSFPTLLNNNIVGSHSPLEVVNLYWDTNWNADNPSLPTMAQIDDFTSTMYTSGYLGPLSQYGVTVGPAHVPPGPGAGY